MWFLSLHKSKYRTNSGVFWFINGALWKQLLPSYPQVRKSHFSLWKNQNGARNEPTCWVYRVVLLLFKTQKAPNAHRDKFGFENKGLIVCYKIKKHKGNCHGPVLHTVYLCRQIFSTFFCTYMSKILLYFGILQMNKWGASAFAVGRAGGENFCTKLKWKNDRNVGRSPSEIILGLSKSVNGRGYHSRLTRETVMNVDISITRSQFHANKSEAQTHEGLNSSWKNTQHWGFWSISPGWKKWTDLWTNKQHFSHELPGPPWSWHPVVCATFVMSKV